ncbi:Glycosyltransferase [Hahella chejuensis KCTC 2396]|uniref:Glycosyltransferase n=1 Tax=Hahella chejuensis (strain KCTC 2396) TaxID=349521 RepID=Q2SN36_HAHCH|nr:glycosyltransferase family 4 protein [Hahella chejuensis]ABC27938.1 Glycosyltransferase [Hahella chejuensis KCTC 2396]
MKIAHIESSINWGGQELRIIEQIEWLRSHNYEAELIARADSKIYLEAQKRNIPAHALDLRGSANPGTIRSLCKLLKHKKYDVLDCHSSRDASYSALAKLFTGQVVVRSRHVIDPIKNDFLHRLVWRVGNDFIITTAEHIKQQIINLGLSTPERIYVAEAGVDSDRFRSELRVTQKVLKQQLGIPEEHVVIANVGMIRRDKGQLYFVKACTEVARRMPNATFIQVGEATDSTRGYKDEVMTEIQRTPFKDRFKFLGYHADVENYLAISDIVVVSSVETEARTRLVSQAYLCGANVVASNIGGLPEMVEHEQTGLIAPAANPKGIAEQVLRLVENKDLADQLRANATQYALDKLTMEGMMCGMLNAYNNALSMKGKK